jgi:DNA-binding Lrp family transcriptional regulator
MAERTRDTSGRYTGSVSNTDVVAAVRAHDPAATSEIGDELGISRQAADRRLRRLRDDGRVSSKKIGASLVWFLPRETGARAPGDAETSADVDTPADTHDAETPAHDAESGVSTPEFKRRIRAYLDERDGGPRKSYAREILADAVVYLREHGDATTAELKSELYPAYADHYGGERAMWESTGGRYLEAAPGVEKIGEGEWSYAGDDAVRAAVATVDDE